MLVSVAPDGFLVLSLRMPRRSGSADYARRRRRWLVAFLRSGDIGMINACADANGFNYAILVRKHMHAGVAGEG